VLHDALNKERDKHNYCQKDKNGNKNGDLIAKYDLAEIKKSHNDFT